MIAPRLRAPVPPPFPSAPVRRWRFAAGALTAAASVTLRGFLRERSVPTAVLVLVGAIALGAVAAGATIETGARLARHLGSAAAGLLGWLLALAYGSGLAGRGAALHPAALARPVPPALLFSGRFLGLAAGLALWAALATSVLAAGLGALGADLTGTGVFAFFLALRLTLVLALAMAGSALLPAAPAAVLAAAAGIAGFLPGRLDPVEAPVGAAVDAAVEPGGSEGIGAPVFGLLRSLLPDFPVLEYPLSGAALSPPPLPELAGPFLYAALYAGAALTLASVLYRRRPFAARGRFRLPTLAALALAPTLFAAAALTADRLRNGPADDRRRPEAQGLHPEAALHPEIAARWPPGLRRLAADFVWLDAVQRYGRARRAGDSAFPRLPARIELALRLDPDFRSAALEGALLVAEPPPLGAGKPAFAERLLERRVARHPADWGAALRLGLVQQWQQEDPEAAAETFRAAAGRPGAPKWMAALAARSRTAGGERDRARLLWRAIAAAAETDRERANAETHLRQLDALERRDALAAAAARFRDRTGRFPACWRDLFPNLANGAPPPLDPSGTPYELLPGGEVRIAPESPLAGHPERRGARPADAPR